MGSMPLLHLLQQIQNNHDTHRVALDAEMNESIDELKQHYDQRIRHADHFLEKQLSALSSLQDALGHLPKHISLSLRHQNNGSFTLQLRGAMESDLNTILFELPPLPIAVHPGTLQLVPPRGQQDEIVFTGVSLVKNKPTNEIHLQWEASSGESALCIECPVAGDLQVWNTPPDVGYNVLEFRGDRWMDYQGNGRYLQPSSPAAALLIERAHAWHLQKASAETINRAFIAQWPGTLNAASQMIANALCAWATNTALPLPESNDLRGWPRHSTKVVHLQSPIVDTTSFSPESHVQHLASRLPNLWRFVDTERISDLVVEMTNAREQTLRCSHEQQPDATTVL